MGGMGGFKQTYRCYSVTMLDNREDVERGGKSKFYIKFCACYIYMYVYREVFLILEEPNNDL